MGSKPERNCKGILGMKVKLRNGEIRRHFIYCLTSKGKEKEKQKEKQTQNIKLIWEGKNRSQSDEEAERHELRDCVCHEVFCDLLAMIVKMVTALFLQKWSGEAALEDFPHERGRETTL